MKYEGDFRHGQDPAPSLTPPGQAGPAPLATINAPISWRGSIHAARQAKLEVKSQGLTKIELPQLCWGPQRVRHFRKSDRAPARAPSRARENAQRLKGNGQKIVGIEECVTFVQRESRRRGGLSGSGSGSGSGTTFAPIRGRLNSRFERLTNSCPRLCRGYLTNGTPDQRAVIWTFHLGTT